MPKKKSVRNSVYTDKPLVKEKKHKTIKIIIITVLISFGVFFIIQNSKNINLEGSWNATKIVINGQDLLSSDNIYDYFDVGNQYINIWGHSLSISPSEQKITANFKIEKDDQGNNYIILSSKESSLNGKFHMKIDTTHLGPQQYRVNIQLHRNTTFIFFEKEVVIPPWKPPFPKKGGV